MTQADLNDDILDLLGVGFGPSNLALAIALEEQAARSTVPRPMRAAFLERQNGFGWHRGMLIEGATMQVSFLKDLVTMRNPASDFSFLTYLHTRGRLATFNNQHDMFPTRVEFHDYLSWAADRMRHLVHYGHEVVEANPVLHDGQVRWIDVTARRVADGALVSCRTRNIVVATGLRPYLPPDAPRSPRVLHSQELLHRVDEIAAGPVHDLVVVGAGQSGAEVVHFLHQRFPAARVHSVFARYGYSPADNSPFVNGVYDPATVDLFYHAPDEVKEMMLEYHANTNYSVVDIDLIKDLHRSVYQEAVVGQRRLVMRNLSRITKSCPTRDGVVVDIQYLPDGTVDRLSADWLVYATGYRPRNPLETLAGISSYCKVDPDGQLHLDRGHRVVTSEQMHCGIYVQGAAESSHGISSTVLSTSAIRAGEIADAISATIAD